MQRKHDDFFPVEAKLFPSLDIFFSVECSQALGRTAVFLSTSASCFSAQHCKVFKMTATATNSAPSYISAVDALPMIYYPDVLKLVLKRVCNNANNFD